MAAHAAICVLSAPSCDERLCLSEEDAMSDGTVVFGAVRTVAAIEGDGRVWAALEAQGLDLVHASKGDRPIRSVDRGRGSCLWAVLCPKGVVRRVISSFCCLVTDAPANSSIHVPHTPRIYHADNSTHPPNHGITTHR